jgi:flagellar biosynthesis/type III secretory pathway protein FliH
VQVSQADDHQAQLDKAYHEGQIERAFQDGIARGYQQGLAQGGQEGIARGRQAGLACGHTEVLAKDTRRVWRTARRSKRGAE